MAAPLVRVNMAGRRVGGLAKINGILACSDRYIHARFSIGKVYFVDGKRYRRGASYWYCFIYFTVFYIFVIIIATNNIIAMIN